MRYEDSGDLEAQVRYWKLQASLWKEQAQKDSLTDLLTRPVLNQVLPMKFAEAVGNLRPLSVLMVDVDHFKAINDTRGHLEGDEVLRKVAAAITRAIRSEDMAFRFGGEEMLVLLPGCGADGAVDVAARVLATVRAFAGVTVSIGAASWPDHGLTAESLLKRADAAMYEAKRGGRDCLRLAS